MKKKHSNFKLIIKLESSSSRIGLASRLMGDISNLKNLRNWKMQESVAIHLPVCQG